METELKLSPVTRKQAERVFSDPEVAPHLSKPCVINMETTYYDTAEGVLQGVHWTLRLRREGNRTICTLKGPADGLTRPELELEAGNISEGAGLLLQTTTLPEEVRAALKQPLQATCGARFARTEALFDDGELCFRLSFDWGELQNGRQSTPLCELEMELVSGTEEKLRCFGEHLAAKHALQVCDMGKHRRALELGKPTVRELSPFFVASELLNYCIRCGYVLFWIDEDKQVHYSLTELGARELPVRFDVDFTKGCASPEEHS